MAVSDGIADTVTSILPNPGQTDATGKCLMPDIATGKCTLSSSRSRSLTPSMHVFLCSANLAATLYLLGQDDFSVFLLDAVLDLFGFMLSNNLVKLRTLSNQMTFAAG